MSPGLTSVSGTRIVGAVAAHDGRGRQAIEKISTGATAPPDGQALENLGDEHEEGDDERREELADDERGPERNRHRQLHRHAALTEVLPRFGEDRPAANDRPRQTEDAQTRAERLPHAKPDHAGDDGNRDDPSELNPFERVRMLGIVPAMGDVVSWERRGLMCRCRSGHDFR